MLLAIFNALLLLGCAVLLWRYPLWFAGKIVPPAQADDRLDLSASAMLRVALIVAGVWLLLARALPNMAFYMGEISSLSSTPAWRVVTRASHFSYMMLIAGVIQTLLAGILMFKTDSVMRLLGGRNGVAETPPATRQ